MPDYERMANVMMELAARDQGPKVSLLASVVLTLLPFLLVVALFAILIPKVRRARAAGRPWGLPKLFGWMGFGLLLIFLVLLAVPRLVL